MEWFERAVMIYSRELAPERVLPPTVFMKSWEKLYSGDFDGLEDYRYCILCPAVPPEPGIFGDEEAYKGFCERLRSGLVLTMALGFLLDPGGEQEIREETAEQGGKEFAQEAGEEFAGAGTREKGIIEWTRRLFSDFLQEPIFAFDLVTPPPEEAQVPGEAREALQVEDFKIPASFVETPFVGAHWKSVSCFVGMGIRTFMGRLFGEGALILYPFAPRAVTRRDMEKLQDIVRDLRERGPVREWLP